jgi:hypothetical protein
MALTYIFEEKVAPWRFPFIVHPDLAVQRIRTMPLFAELDVKSSG